MPDEQIIYIFVHFFSFLMLSVVMDVHKIYTNEVSISKFIHYAVHDESNEYWMLNIIILLELIKNFNNFL